MRRTDTPFYDYVWNTLLNNGWLPAKPRKDDDGFDRFCMTFLCEYRVTIYAVVSRRPKHLELDGHYGVLWLEAEYENEGPHTYKELENMQQGISVAETNLHQIDIPFTENYPYHTIDGYKKSKMEAKNQTIRRRLNLAMQEKEDDR